MRKSWLIVSLVIAVVAVYFLFFHKKEERENDVLRQAPLALGKKSETFNAPFNKMLNSYFYLKSALVDWDTAKANAAAAALTDLSRLVPYSELKSDTTIAVTANSFSENVIAEAQGLIGENTIEEKRRSFYILSENLYDLLRTVRYDQQVIYYDKCPMAFNDEEEAYWISNTREIINPYLGKKHPRYAGGMIGCGSIEDSIDYRSK